MGYTMSDRREFLKFLAGSPLLLASPAWLEAFTQAPTSQAAAATLASAADALDVYDFEAMARRVLPPAHWGYMATGTDGEETLRANPRGFDRYQLRVRRFVDVSRIDMGMEIFGQTFASPIMLCPVGSQRAFHAEGELAAARAARARGQLQILSTQSSTAIEDVARARGGSGLWYQLYTTNNWDVTTKLLQRAEAAGCPVVAVTVDLPAGRNTLTDQRMARVDARACASCHGAAGPAADGRAAGVKPMFAGIDMKGVTLTSATLTWDFVKRVKDVTKMKVLIKGLESGDDAALAVSSGADGIIVSNHGGRATESGRPTIDALPEVVQGARGRIPVLLDGGVRRGTDVFKALALGATAVGIGRPYLWGLSSFGQAGVERVLQILDTELRLAMVGCGTVALKDITAKSIIGRRLRM
jgi:isopentenyl diphosphate isomerase/L-lactate dehydrogenase-like FMN-dependent dehydrogenase